MVRLFVNLDVGSPELVLKREVPAGGAFDVGLVAEQDEAESEPAIFDTLVFEILYNDRDYLITSDPRARPLPGELIHNTTRDAFTHHLLTSGGPHDRDYPFSEASLLTLRPPHGDRIGPYKTGTGRAGYMDHERPFELPPGQRSTVMAGRLFTLAEAPLGESSLIILGQLMYKNELIATDSIVSTITVEQRPAAV
jgi:hypothetical protein